MRCPGATVSNMRVSCWATAPTTCWNWLRGHSSRWATRRGIRVMPLRALPANILVVLDEAYNEYLPEESRYDSVAWLKEFPNLIISRTFSKAYGLAGLRVGYAFAHVQVADMMNRVRQPFNVNSVAQGAAGGAFAAENFG